MRGERDAKIYEELFKKRSKVLLPSIIGSKGNRVVAVTTVLFSLALVSFTAYKAVSSKHAQMMLVIPGVTIKTLYGIVGILVSIPYAVFIHEASHAFAGIRRGIRPKGTGVISLGPFVLAYVTFEDEEEVDSVVASAGVLANFVAAIMFVILLNALVYLLSPYSSGVLVTSGPEGLVGKVIIAVNGVSVSNVNEFLEVRSKIPDGDVVELKLADGSAFLYVKGSSSLALTNRYFGGILGVIVAITLAIMYRSFVINFSLGVINALPIIGLDGSKIVYDILKDKIKNEGALFAILMSLSAYSIILLILSIVPRSRTPSVSP